MNANSRTNEICTREELVAKMAEVDVLVKASKWSTKLGALIYDVCRTLQFCGKDVEEAHQTDLDAFFASIRQANCRENGELGLPCRLKITETLELRVMGWRPNLAHAKYYAKRERDLELLGGSERKASESPKQSPAPTAHSTPPLPAPSAIRSTPPALSKPTAAETPKPTSSGLSPFAPPFIPPFPPPPPGAMFPSPPPQFFPAGGFVPQTQHLPLFNMIFHQKLGPGTFLPNLLDGMGLSPNELPPKGNKLAAAQLREEVTIKNSDSGKVMGVKGRRVALIEAISKTVISFQKVDPKCKERQLVIIGEQREAIECAKRLIGETIEKNESPERPLESTEASAKGAGVVALPISIEKCSDRTLKIDAQDPAILDAIREALNEHLKLRLGNNGRKNSDAETEERECQRRTSDGLSGGPCVYTREQMLHIREHTFSLKNGQPGPREEAETE